MPQQPGLRASRAGVGGTHRAALADGQTASVIGPGPGWAGREMECAVSYFRSPGTSCSPDN